MSNRSITDFFKPYAYPRQTKHPLPDDEELREPRPFQRSRSNTPRATTPQQNIPVTASNDAILVSSQSSALSSLQDLPPSTPDELPNSASEDLTGRAKECSGALSIEGNETLSQAHVISSSQRIIKNGKVVIRDSDEDRSDTDTSLDDIDDLLRGHNARAETSPGSRDELPSIWPPPATRLRTAKSSAHNQARTATATAYQSPVPIATPKYKFSLDALVKKRQQDDDSQVIIESAQSLLEGLEERKSLPARTGKNVLDEGLLAAVISDGNDDGGSIDRLMAAIERTEALDQQKVWSFFRDDQGHAHAEPADCPSIADTYWQKILEGSFPFSLGLHIPDTLSRPYRPSTSVPERLFWRMCLLSEASG